MTKRFQSLLVTLFLAGAIPPGLSAALASDDADAPIAAGSSTTPCPAGMPSSVAPDGTTTCGVVVTTTVPSDKLHDPVVNPMAALNDERDLQRQGWAVFLLGVLLMLARGLQSWAPSHKDDVGKVGAAARWLAGGARAFAIAGVIATAGAAYNALVLGGAWGAVVLAAIGAGFAALVPAKRPTQGAPLPTAQVVASGAALSLVMLLVCATAIPTAVTACSGTQRTDTINAALVTVDAARDGLVAYDAKAQFALVGSAASRDDATGKLAAYRNARDAATGPAGLLATAYRAIAAAATANDDPSIAGMKSAIAQFLSTVAPYLGGSK